MGGGGGTIWISNSFKSSTFELSMLYAFRLESISLKVKGVFFFYEWTALMQLAQQCSVQWQNIYSLLFIAAWSHHLCVEHSQVVDGEETFQIWRVLDTYSVILEKQTSSHLVKKFLHFLEIKGSLPHSQVPATCPYPEPHRSSPCSQFLKIHLNIILPSMPRSSKWSLLLMFPHQNPVYASPLPHLNYITRPLHYSRFDHPNNIGWGVQTIKLLIM
jgi:hypothetical protein